MAAVFLLLGLGFILPLLMNGDDDETDEFVAGETADDVVASFTSGLDTPDGFNIDIDFRGAWSEEQQHAVIEAAEFLSDVILSDIENTTDPRTGEPIDDLFVDFRVDNFIPQNADGTTILGQAQLIAARPDSGLPSVVEITLNGAMDIDHFQDTALHELMHAVGFGFSTFGNQVIDPPGPDGPRFAGANATAAYASAFAGEAAADPGSHLGVPVTADGGHWDESVFPAELMSPIRTHAAPDETLSTISIAALEDLGYDTVWDDITDPNDRTGPIPNLPFDHHHSHMHA
jgi:hypothetical protein